MGSPSSTYRSPLRPFAPQRGSGSPHTSGMQGGLPEQRQETRNPGRSRRCSRTLPPAAQRVVFHEGVDRDHGGPCDPHAQRTSSTSDPRRRSKRPRTKRAHIPTILTPVERERQAALHADPPQAADGASSSSAASLPGSAANSLSGGPHAADKQPREPAADPRPAQGAGGQPPPTAPKLSRHGGHIATTGARRERPKGGRRNGRDLRPSGVRKPTARCHDLLGAPATGALHGVRAWGTSWHHLTAPLPD